VTIGNSSLWVSVLVFALAVHDPENFPPFSPTKYMWTRMHVNRGKHAIAYDKAKRQVLFRFINLRNYLESKGVLLQSPKIFG